MLHLSILLIKQEDLSKALQFLNIDEDEFSAGNGSSNFSKTNEYFRAIQHKMRK